MSGFFGFFDYGRPGKGVEKDEYVPRRKLFFDILWRKFAKIMGVNILFVLSAIPTIFLFFIASSAFVLDDNSFSPYFILYEIFAFVFCTIVGFGITMPGLTYILRKFIHEQHAWLWTDFIKGIRLNFKKGIALTIIDFLAFLAASLAFFVYHVMAEDAFIFYCLRAVVVVTYAFWIMMHFYMYQIMVTFNVKFRHMISNAFLMTFAHLPRTLILFASVLFIGWLTFYPPIAMSAILYAVIIPAFVNYLVNFNVAPVIDMYMLEPLEDDEKIPKENGKSKKKKKK